MAFTPTMVQGGIVVGLAFIVFSAFSNSIGNGMFYEYGNEHIPDETKAFEDWNNDETWKLLDWQGTADDIKSGKLKLPRHPDPEIRAKW